MRGFRCESNVSKRLRLCRSSSFFSGICWVVSFQDLAYFSSAVEFIAMSVIPVNVFRLCSDVPSLSWLRGRDTNKEWRPNELRSAVCHVLTSFCKRLSHQDRSTRVTSSYGRKLHLPVSSSMSFAQCQGPMFLCFHGTAHSRTIEVRGMPVLTMRLLQGFK